MIDFIKEFYYGNIDPQARSTKGSKTISKELSMLSETEEYLTTHLTGKDKDKFLDFANAWSVMLGESNLDSFIVGFRLGAKFTYDTFISNDSPFSDFLSENKHHYRHWEPFSLHNLFPVPRQPPTCNLSANSTHAPFSNVYFHDIIILKCIKKVLHFVALFYL